MPGMEFQNVHIDLQFDKRLGSSAAETSVKFKSEQISLQPYLVGSRNRNI